MKWLLWKFGLVELIWYHTGPVRKFNDNKWTTKIVRTDLENGDRGVKFNDTFESLEGSLKSEFREYKGLGSRPHIKKQGITIWRSNRARAAQVVRSFKKSNGELNELDKQNAAQANQSAVFAPSMWHPIINGNNNSGSTLTVSTTEDDDAI